MNLTVVHVLERPPAGWAGEIGFVTAELLSRHRPRGYRRFQFFICGPGPMMDAAEIALIELGVPAERWPHRAFRHGVSMRHVQISRLVWLIAGLLVVACLVFAAAQS